MIEDMDHVGVVVADLASARGFVTEALGFTSTRVIEIPDRLRAEYFSRGGCQIELIEISDPSERAARLGGEARARLDHIALRAPDIHAAVGELAGLGVTFDGGGVVTIGDQEVAFTVADTTEGVRFQLVGSSPVA